jgi:predicted NAD/FAD-binding protein
VADVLVRIAVVGAGIAGLTAAYLLDRAHEVELFEAEPLAGGHANTVRAGPGGPALESGFIVCNDRTYPGFLGLLRELGVPLRESEMSFSVRCGRCGLEYSGHGARGLFAQPRNALDPRFLRMLADLGRFFRRAPEVLDDPRWERATIGEYLDAGRYGSGVVDHFLAPMGAAIWSSSTTRMREMPARFLVEFFRNHGLLGVRTAPIWRTVEGGSRRYVDALLARLRGPVRLALPVRSVRRDADGVELVAGDDAPRRFDHVVIATHADQALALLADPSAAERAALAGIPFSVNETVVHVGDALLPRHRAARASWNVSLDDCRAAAPRVAMTYWLNRLQRLGPVPDYCVSLNQSDRIAGSDVIARMTYAHPLYTFESVAARDALRRLSGERRTDYCGAYLGWGFHEDGHRSGAEVAARIGAAA